MKTNADVLNLEESLAWWQKEDSQAFVNGWYSHKDMTMKKMLAFYPIEEDNGQRIDDWCIGRYMRELYDANKTMADTWDELLQGNF